MAKARLLVSEKALANIPPEKIDAVLESKNIMVSETPFGSPPGTELLYVKSAVDWKGDPTKLPEGSKTGLGKAIGTSRACAGVTGTTVDPKTGNEVPRKVLCQRSASPGRAARKAYRRPGAMTAEALGISVPAIARPAGF